MISGFVQIGADNGLEGRIQRLEDQIRISKMRLRQANDAELFAVCEGILAEKESRLKRLYDLLSLQ